MAISTQFPMLGHPVTLEKRYSCILSAVMIDFMARTLVMDPEKRFCSAECLEHPAFQVSKARCYR